MRIEWLAALMLLSACASEKLALRPPAGVDFSGHWKLNIAESDDPQRLVLAQVGGSSAGGRRSPEGQGGQDGQGGGGRGGFAAPGVGGPSLPAVTALSEGLRWPGKELEVKQAAGVVAITSLGESRVYQPSARTAHSAASLAPRNRDHRMGLPPTCGWDENTLVVQSSDIDEDHPPFQQRYSVSDDGRRLIEVVGFAGSRAGGYTISRVWDKE